MKSTFLGKESTSPVKVVNCTQTRQSTFSVWKDTNCLGLKQSQSQNLSNEIEILTLCLILLYI